VQSRCRQRSQCRQASLDPGALERKCTPCHRARAGAAALVELVAEPLYILGAAQLRFGLRVGAEAAATLARGALTLALLARGACAPALALSWGQARPRARPLRSPTALERLLPAALGREACLAPVRCRIGLTCVCWAAQLAYAGVTLAAYVAAYAPELAAQHRKGRTAAASGAACAAPPAASGSEPACSARPAAALDARRRAVAAEPEQACPAGGGQPDQAQQAGGAAEGEGARGHAAKDAAAERSCGADGDAGFRDTRPAADGARRGHRELAGRCSGEGEERRPLLEGRTLRLCASFTLQARTP